jgi:hypothetical protein
VQEEQHQAREAASKVNEDSAQVAAEIKSLEIEIEGMTARRQELSRQAQQLKVRGVEVILIVLTCIVYRFILGFFCNRHFKQICL